MGEAAISFHYNATFSAETRRQGMIYPDYMSKVNAHCEQTYPRIGARNYVPEVDSIVMCIVKGHSERIDSPSGVFHSVSGVGSFIMRIYFAHVFGVFLMYMFMYVCMAQPLQCRCMAQSAVSVDCAVGS